MDFRCVQSVHICLIEPVSFIASFRDGAIKTDNSSWASQSIEPSIWFTEPQAPPSFLLETLFISAGSCLRGQGMPPGIPPHELSLSTSALFMIDITRPRVLSDVSQRGHCREDRDIPREAYAGSGNEALDLTGCHSGFSDAGVVRHLILPIRLEAYRFARMIWDIQGCPASLSTDYLSRHTYTNALSFCLVFLPLAPNYFRVREAGVLYLPAQRE